MIKLSIKAAFRNHLETNPLKGHLTSASFRDHLQNTHSRIQDFHSRKMNSYLEIQSNASNNQRTDFRNYLSPNNEKFSFKQEYDNKSLSFRNFSDNDLEGCAELFKRVFSVAPWYDDWKSLDQVKNYLNELISNPFFEGFLIQEDEKIVAVCMGRRRSWWMGKEFFVDEFFVANNMQGKGIGTKLMDFVTQSLSNEGYTRLVLLTNKEIPAETFYLKNAFYNKLERTVMVRDL